jgi:hypothetical protein
MYFAVVKLLKLVSVLACLIVIVSFSLFAIRQAEGASERQQSEVLNGAPVPASEAVPGAAQAKPPHAGAVRKAIDEASSKLTSPFNGIDSGSHSEWTIRTLRLVLALAVYGFGLGFLARTMRVRS